MWIPFVICPALIVAGAAAAPPPTLDLNQPNLPPSLDVPVVKSEAPIYLRTSKPLTIRFESELPTIRASVQGNVSGPVQLSGRVGIPNDSQLLFSGVIPGQQLKLWIAPPEGDESSIEIRFVAGEGAPSGFGWSLVAQAAASLLGLAGLAAATVAFRRVRKAEDNIEQLKQMVRMKSVERHGEYNMESRGVPSASGLQGIERRLAELEERLGEAVPGSRQAQGEGNYNLQDLSRQFDKRFSTLEGSIKNLTDTAARTLDGSLKILVDPALADRLNEGASDFFRRAVPERDGLNERLRAGRELGSAIDGFLSTVAVNRTDLRDAMQPVRREASVIEGEAEALARAVEEQTLRLDFQVVFSTSPASKETIAEALAGGLRREILKLAEPLAYFDRRLRSIGLRAGQAALEYLDRFCDLSRRNEAYQSAFNTLLRAAGLTAILPHEGEAYSPDEHQVEQWQPSQDLARSHTVARVVARGLRQDSRVAQKASVWLYQ
ncbi:MAG: hypothetical protein KIT09_00685 [Bryobacteraceae bacterium]|nr:hypothetical protein [Bryobacteraceae bacterium]